MQPPTCRRRLSYCQTSITSRQLTFLAVVYGSLALVLSSSLVDLRADKCCCPSRTPQRRGNCKGRGTPENVARLAALFHVLQHGVAGEIEVESVHADFPSSGFASGPVFGTSGPVAFDVVFHVNEAAAVHYTAGFEAVPGAVVLAHDVYAFDRAAIAGSTFSFGNQTFSEPYLHNLSFALLAQGVISAPMFLSDITPGSTPFIEVGALNVFLGSYAFGPFVPGNLPTVSLTNGADVFDGVNQAFGTVRVRVAAVPIPLTLALVFGGGAAISRHCRRAKAT